MTKTLTPEPLRQLRSRRFAVRAAFLAASLALVTTGCKKQAPSSAPPMGGELSDDIANLEAEITANADRLQGEGIYVAAADLDVTSKSDHATGISAGPTEPPPPKPAPEPEPEPVVADEENDVEPEDEAPMAEAPAPTSMPESVYEEAEDDRGPRRSRLERRRAKKEAATRCERICDLAAATCELSDHVCGLARRHPDEPRYENACERSAAQCEAAADACNACATR